MNGRTPRIVKPEPLVTRQGDRLSTDAAPNGFADLAVPRQLRSSFGDHSGGKERESAEPEDALEAGWLQEEAGDLRGADGESPAPPPPPETQHSIFGTCLQRQCKVHQSRSCPANLNKPPGPSTNLMACLKVEPQACPALASLTLSMFTAW